MANKNYYTLFLELYGATENGFKTSYQNSLKTGNFNTFKEAVFIVMKSCLNKMEETKSLNKDTIKPIYSNYGLNDHYFDIFFHLYRIENKDEDRRYKKIKTEILALSILEELKNRNFTKEAYKNLAKNYETTITNIVNFETLALSLIYKRKIVLAKYKRTYLEFKKYIHGDHNSLKNALIYYRNFALDTEKEAFITYLNTNHEQLRDIEACEILDLVNKRNKESILLRLKKYYELCHEAMWNKKDLKDSEYSQDEIFKMAKTYASIIFKIYDIDKAILEYRGKLQPFKIDFHSKGIDLLIDANIPEEIDKIINEYNITKIKITSYCYAKNRDMTNSERKELETKLLNKLISYLERQKVKKELAKQANYNDAFYVNYLNGELDYVEFCKQNKIIFYEFHKYIVNIKNPIILDQVKTRIEREKNQKSSKKYIAIPEERIIALNDALRNGINGKPLDLLDYFLYFNDLNYPIKRMLEFIDSDNSLTYQKLLKRGTVLKKYYPENATKQVYYFNTVRDQNGNPIPNTGIKIAKKELIEIINYLDSLNLPRYEIILQIAIKRYANNSLFTYNTLQTEKHSLK